MQPFHLTDFLWSLRTQKCDDSINASKFKIFLEILEAKPLSMFSFMDDYDYHSNVFYTIEILESTKNIFYNSKTLEYLLDTMKEFNYYSCQLVEKIIIAVPNKKRFLLITFHFYKKKSQLKI